MAITYPETRKEISQRIGADIQANIPALNPFLLNSMIRSLGISNSSIFFDIYSKIELLEREKFLINAKNLQSIQEIGFLKGIDLKPASTGRGLVTATGTNETVLPLGTALLTADNAQYQVIEQDYTINEQIINVSSLTSNGTIITAVMPVEHHYSINMSVTIAGATQTDYNGTYAIASIPDEKTFTYAKTIGAGTATGTITATATSASVEIESLGTGLAQNLENGAQLSLATPLAGINNDLYVQFYGIVGASDEETNDEYKARVIEAYRNPIALWNNTYIRLLVLSIPGVTRSWVFDTTPRAGDSTIYFVRDNDSNIIPNALEIQQVKDVLYADKPSFISVDQMIVNAPTPITVNFAFTVLSPDSLNLRNAIELSLTQFFREKTNVGENITEDKYKSVIQETINPDTGQKPDSFTLSAPIGDITINTGELGVLGTISYT